MSDCVGGVGGEGREGRDGGTGGLREGEKVGGGGGEGSEGGWGGTLTDVCVCAGREKESEIEREMWCRTIIYI